MALALVLYGLVGLFGLVEFKAPQTNTHIQTLLDQKVPESTTFRCSGNGLHSAPMVRLCQALTRAWLMACSCSSKRVEFDLYWWRVWKRGNFLLQELDSKIEQLNKLKV